jgi:hypothetical protein
MISSCLYTYDSVALSCTRNSTQNSTTFCVTEDYPGYCSVCQTGYYNSSYTYQSVYFQECLACMQNCLACADNLTCLTCKSGFTLSSNQTCYVQALKYSLQIQAVIDAFTSLISGSTAALTNNVPSARSILRPFLFVLVSFDDLFPYMYHERDYGSSFKSLFASIHSA